MKLRVASLVALVLLAFSILSSGYAKAQTPIHEPPPPRPVPVFTFSSDQTNVAYNGTANLSWTSQNVTWCWGYRWSTIQVDPDGSGWVEPQSSGTHAVGPLTSDKTYSMNCGTDGNPLQIQSLTITVGPQALSIQSFDPTSGAQGTKVVITGTAFSKVQFVRFGTTATCLKGKNATYTVDGTSQITATVATGMVTGKICIKAGTTTITSVNDFTITPLPTFNFQVCTYDPLQAWRPGSPNCSSRGITINVGQQVVLGWTVNAQVTWCWGTGGLWGGGSWVQPPDPDHPGTGGSVQDTPAFTTTYTLQCGAPSNPQPIQSQKVTVTGQPPPPPVNGALPYFKVNGGDVFAGGWFNTDSTACDNSDPTYQSPSAPKSNDPTDGTKGRYAGGIITYGTPPTNGSATNQSVFALGDIVHDNNSYYGFMTGGSNTQTFSNFTYGVGSALWGGQFEGSTPQTHCIPDYFNTKKDLPKPWPNTLTGLASGQYLQVATGGAPVTVPASQINVNQNVTLFIDGDAYIKGNITYTTTNETINDIPKFALIVRGNIFIDPAVTQLWGFYVAQPQEDNSDGTIFTCHANNTAVAPARDYISKNCRTKLVINGAVAAADIEFDRVSGDLLGAHSTNTPAETINFIPEMILGGSFFHGPSAATSNQAKIDSIISLPPVF